MSHHHKANSRPTLERWANALPPETIAQCLGKLEVALNHGNKEEAVAAIEMAFGDMQPEEVTLDSPLNALRLPERLTAGLERKGVLIIDQLCQWSIMELRTIPNFGPAYVRMVQTALDRHGWSLRCDLAEGSTGLKPITHQKWLDRIGIARRVG